ncbi:MAG: heavy metal-binding domain-containing protein [Chthoniobacterales bacterium]
MNRIILTGLVGALTFGAMVACDQNKTTATNAATPSTAQKYTCTMHPDVVQDAPGKCPKCGMELVVKK